MISKHTLRTWVVDALTSLGGSGSVVEVCEVIWERHEDELREAGDLFYTWQYDVRWAAQVLRNEGALVAAEGRRGGPWRVA